MDKSPLHEPLQNEEWQMQLKKMHSVSGALGFDDLIYLVQTAPSLRVAFDPDWQMGLNRMQKVNYYKINTFRLHGIQPFFGIEDTLDASDGLSLEVIAENSLIDADVWDGFAEAIAEIVRDEHLLLPASRAWASEVIKGQFRRPKIRPGPHPLKHQARDNFVVGFLFQMEQLSVPITENEATMSGISACHAISKGLGSYFTVPSPKSLMNIWSSRSQNWRDISGNE